MRRWGIAIVIAASCSSATAGCGALRSLWGGGAGPASGPAASSAGPAVHAYSDPLPVTAIAYQAPFLWAGNPRGLVRWNVTTEEVQRIGPEQGLPGSDVSAIAIDGKGGLWAVTDKGVGRIADSRYTPMPALPAGAQVSLLQPLPAGDGLWAGGPTGLLRTDGKTWAEIPALHGVPVTSLELDKVGALWVGTRGRGLVRVDVGGGVRGFGPADGVDLVDVVGSGAFDTGVHVAAGRGARGARVLLVGDQGVEAMAPYPDVALLRLARVGSEIVLLAGDDAAPKLYKLRLAQRGDLAPEGGFRLLPERKAPDAPRYAVVPLALMAPPHTTVIAPTPDGIWFGTASLGVARAAAGLPTYFRSGELAQGAQRITVACPQPPSCVVVTGGPRVWRFDGRLFTPTHVGEPAGARVEAVLTDHTGTVYSVWHEAGYAGFVVARFESGAWNGFRRIPVEVPSGDPEFAWGAMSPTGNMWIGVHYKEKDGQDRPYGAVEQDFIRQRALHHRQYGEGESPAPGALPLNNTIGGVVFDGPSMWFASHSGVVRWQESEVKVWGENEGLENELVSGVAVDGKGGAWAATPAGVARFDGKVWRMGDALRMRANAVVRDRRDRVWAGTQKGMVLLSPDGPQVIDSSRGLVEDLVRDVTADAFGRVWGLGRESLVVVE